MIVYKLLLKNIFYVCRKQKKRVVEIKRISQNNAFRSIIFYVSQASISASRTKPGFKNWHFLILLYYRWKFWNQQSTAFLNQIFSCQEPRTDGVDLVLLKRRGDVVSNLSIVVQYSFNTFYVNSGNLSSLYTCIFWKFEFSMTIKTSMKRFHR